MTISSTLRRRSCLTVPGGSEKMLGKAACLAADEIVFDLEDAVARPEKANARRRVMTAITSGTFAGRTISVRVNAIGTPWCHEDIAELGALHHPGLTLVLPKVESAADLAFIDRLLDGIEAAHPRTAPIGIQALIETAAGIANVTAIAGSSARLETLILGYADLASSLGRSGGASWLFAQESLLVAARANGLQAIDGPSFSLSADAALEHAARAVAAMGFDGKWAIHPSHIPVLNAAFSPSAEMVAKARDIISRINSLQAGGNGAGGHGGEMIDEAMRLGALRILSRGEAPT
jgi:citrate lyase subunit beta/citryl-CoA lyase